jgi:stearoyl-CoA desaturase (delta-9 desaturase)
MSWYDGILNLPWWGLVLAALALTHVTIVSVTLYLHRHQAHRALDLHPAVAHFFRFWLWLTTGMVTREWVSIHRKHHAKCETPQDPHSPQVLGIGRVLWQGAELYKAEARNRDTVEHYGHHTPDDWLERRIYGRYSLLGPTLMLVIDLVLFGVAGLAVWGVQMLWIPFWAAGVINGVGHWWGYRNFETIDASTNIVCWGLLIGGEELHNNHHAFASSAKFSVHSWEFDVGWLYIRALTALRLARVKKLAPVPVRDAHRQKMDLDSVRALFANRMHVMTHYAREVLVPVLREEVDRTDRSWRRLFRQTRALVTNNRLRLDESAREMLESVLARFSQLRVAYQFREQLAVIWERSATSHEHLLEALQDWCRRAEDSGVLALEQFASRMKDYRMVSPAI